MKIVCLAENTSVSHNIGYEHGLSLYIQCDAGAILFDMGQTDLFSENAKKLNVDLSSVRYAVISHGHYDHGGGLESFLKINSSAPVYINPYAFDGHYNGTNKYIGLSPALKNDPRLVYTQDKHIIKNGITLFTCKGYPEYHNFGSFGLNTLEGENFVPDDFKHEQYLLIEENGKRVLFSGCSHRGILNIAKWIKADIIIGGFHFSKLPLDNTLQAYARELNESGITFYTCHCTGVEQYSFMKRYMNKLNYLSAGQTIIL
ncbi:MAG: MBL fold metallo-hydrolase [Clostridia bacterium]|nr:MBL fold metallo-hydrolase [Clostridia bacterium]